MNFEIVSGKPEGHEWIFKPKITRPQVDWFLVWKFTLARVVFQRLSQNSRVAVIYEHMDLKITAATNIAYKNIYIILLCTSKRKKKALTDKTKYNNTLFWSSLGTGTGVYLNLNIEYNQKSWLIIAQLRRLNIISISYHINIISYQSYHIISILLLVVPYSSSRAKTYLLGSELKYFTTKFYNKSQSKISPSYNIVHFYFT